MTADELKNVLENHAKWCNTSGGSRADLTDADLTDAVLTDAVLTDADLRGAVLTDADLTGAVLTGADLTRAVLTPIKEDVFAAPRTTAIVRASSIGDRGGVGSRMDRGSSSRTDRNQLGVTPCSQPPTSNSTQAGRQRFCRRTEVVTWIHAGEEQEEIGESLNVKEVAGNHHTRKKGFSPWPH